MPAAPVPIAASLGAMDQGGPHFGLSLPIIKCPQVSQLPLRSSLSPFIAVPPLPEHRSDAGGQGGSSCPRDRTIMELYFLSPAHSSGTSRVLFYPVVPTADSSDWLPSTGTLNNYRVGRKVKIAPGGLKMPEIGMPAMSRPAGSLAITGNEVSL